MANPATRYAKSGEARIAYQVVGQGPLDLVFLPGNPSNLEVQWEEPGFSHLLHRLATFTQLILLDPRGTGLSDRVGVPAPTRWTSGY
jgi:pimeloyl-ACP methyl ester carboxylesterase